MHGIITLRRQGTILPVAIAEFLTLPYLSSASWLVPFKMHKSPFTWLILQTTMIMPSMRRGFLIGPLPINQVLLALSSRKCPSFGHINSQIVYNHISITFDILSLGIWYSFNCVRPHLAFIFPWNGVNAHLKIIDKWASATFDYNVKKTS